MANEVSRRGEAVYVDDESNPDMCAADATQNSTSTTDCFSSSVFFNFSNNFAGEAGLTFLKECTVHTKFFQETLDIGCSLNSLVGGLGEGQVFNTSSEPVQILILASLLSI